MRCVKKEVKRGGCHANCRQPSKLELVQTGPASSPHPPGPRGQALPCLPRTSTAPVTRWLQLNSEACLFFPEHLGSPQALRYDINGKHEIKIKGKACP